MLALALVLGTTAVVDRLRGGASSPTALADRLTTALGEEDLGALAHLVEPSERSGLARLVSAWSARLDGLDLPAAAGGGDGGGDPLDGLDLTLTGTTARVEARAGDLAVVGLPDLALEVRSDPDRAHGLLRTWFTYRRMTEPHDQTYRASALPPPLTQPRFVAVERSGRWYVSPLATLLGPGIDVGRPLQVRAPGSVASSTPQAAAEATLRALVESRGSGDPASVADTLDASGADTLQLWLSEVTAAGSAGPERLDVLTTAAGPETSTTTSVVLVSELRTSGPLGLSLSGGCVELGRTRTCLRPSGYRYVDGVPDLSKASLLGHDGAFRLTAVRDGDGWRTSLSDSLADALVAYAAGLSRAQVLALLRRPTLDRPGAVLRPDVADDVTFTDAGYALVDLHVERAGLYRVAPSPAGTNRAAVYDADGRPSIQPYYPNDSVYDLAAGEHRVLVWADDAFTTTLDRRAPYVQQVEVRGVR